MSLHDSSASAMSSRREHLDTIAETAVVIQGALDFMLRRGVHDPELERSLHANGLSLLSFLRFAPIGNLTPTDHDLSDCLDDMSYGETDDMRRRGEEMAIRILDHDQADVHYQHADGETMQWSRSGVISPSAMMYRSSNAEVHDVLRSPDEDTRHLLEEGQELWRTAMRQGIAAQELAAVLSQSLQNISTAYSLGEGQRLVRAEQRLINNAIQSRDARDRLDALAARARRMGTDLVTAAENEDTHQCTCSECAGIEAEANGCPGRGLCRTCRQERNMRVTADPRFVHHGASWDMNKGERR